MAAAAATHDDPPWGADDEQGAYEQEESQSAPQPVLIGGIHWNTIHPTIGWNRMGNAMNQNRNQFNPVIDKGAAGIGIDIYAQMLKEPYPHPQLENNPEIFQTENYIDALRLRLVSDIVDDDDHGYDQQILKRIQDIQNHHWMELPKMNHHWSKPSYCANVPCHFQTLMTEHHLSWAPLLNDGLLKQWSSTATAKVTELLKYGTPGSMELNRHIYHQILKDKTHKRENPFGNFLRCVQNSIEDMKKPEKVGNQEYVYFHPHEGHKDMKHLCKGQGASGYVWKFDDPKWPQYGYWQWTDQRDLTERYKLESLIGMPWPNNHKSKGAGRDAKPREEPENVHFQRLKKQQQFHFASPQQGQSGKGSGKYGQFGGGSSQRAGGWGDYNKGKGSNSNKWQNTDSQWKPDQWNDHQKQEQNKWQPWTAATDDQDPSQNASNQRMAGNMFSIHNLHQHKKVGAIFGRQRGERECKPFAGLGLKFCWCKVVDLSQPGDPQTAKQQGWYR